MCGIAAVFGKRNDAEERVRTMLSRTLHRGNHPYEMEKVEGGAMGTNRLALVDEPHSVQPQKDEAGEIYVVFNGEIFNYEEHIASLKKIGYAFKTNGDTETLIYLWKEYGHDMMSQLDSEMFAFVIYDSRTDEIFAARDRTGVKPLYYASDAGGNLYFTSELKAFADFQEITEIHEFPPGHFYTKGKFKSYWEAKTDMRQMTSYEETVTQLGILLEQAVEKRVRTNLPIGVFLSGGVDSSLMMELAMRYHSNVTALILGNEKESSDFKYATQLCKERGWKYEICEPHIDYTKELEDLIFSLEAWNANAVQHSFANKAISKFAHGLGYKIILTGEGSDELFAGYNEFMELPLAKISEGCKRMLESMSKASHMRVDKMAMKYTLETRSPFFDNKIIDLAFRIPGEWKIGEYKSKKYSKFILRDVAQKYLPEYIAWREKVPFANGAGLDVSINYTKPSGIFAKIAQARVSDAMFLEMKEKHPESRFQTKEEVLFFSIYESFGYTKFVEGNHPLVMKDVLVKNLMEVPV